MVRCFHMSCGSLRVLVLCDMRRFTGVLACDYLGVVTRATVVALASTSFPSLCTVCNGYTSGNHHWHRRFRLYPSTACRARLFGSEGEAWD